jgi:hypothetical protein
MSVYNTSSKKKKEQTEDAKGKQIISPQDFHCIPFIKREILTNFYVKKMKKKSIEKSDRIVCPSSKSGVIAVSFSSVTDF